MIILPGAVKADLFRGALVSADSANGPGTAPTSLADIDAHFWDWDLWLGAKRLRAQDELVGVELAKIWRYLLRPSA